MWQKQAETRVCSSKNVLSRVNMCYVCYEVTYVTPYTITVVYLILDQGPHAIPNHAEDYCKSEHRNRVTSVYDKNTNTVN